MACGCKGGKGATSPSPMDLAAARVQSPASRENMVTQLDSDYEMVDYTHPNRGQHPVVGMSTGRSYGYRAGGGVERFLVHRSDIAASPNFFKIVSKVPTAPTKAVEPPPPPEPIVTTKDPVVDDSKLTPLPPESPAVREFDLQALPGVTPNIAKSFIGMGLLSADDIIEAGPAALETVKQVGKVKANLIFEHVRDNYGSTA